MLKTGLNSLKTASFSVTSEEAPLCLFQLKSCTEKTQVDHGSAICLQPGTSHVFFPESQGDALLVEVQNINRVPQGQTIIQISSLTDNHGDRAQWWPIYDGDRECVGKLQLSITNTSTSCDISTIKKSMLLECETQAENLLATVF